MAGNKNSRVRTGVSLGDLQSGVEQTAINLKAAQTAYLSAVQRLAGAQEAHEQANVNFNQGVANVKANTRVVDLLAR